ncbi:MAG: hypothetical protein ACE37I_03355 [Rubinisphaera brasiliensis]|uniref:hypothetical protein n=1 Tax=Rubinisphaera brasiliensis TaxID=119 RepID=UPI00391AE35B
MRVIEKDGVITFRQIRIILPGVMLVTVAFVLLSGELETFRHPAIWDHAPEFLLHLRTGWESVFLTFVLMAIVYYSLSSFQWSTIVFRPEHIRIRSFHHFWFRTSSLPVENIENLFLVGNRPQSSVRKSQQTHWSSTLIIRMKDELREVRIDGLFLSKQRYFEARELVKQLRAGYGFDEDEHRAPLPRSEFRSDDGIVHVCKKNVTAHIVFSLLFAAVALNVFCFTVPGFLQYLITAESIEFYTLLRFAGFLVSGLISSALALFLLFTFLTNKEIRVNLQTGELSATQEDSVLRTRDSVHLVDVERFGVTEEQKRTDNSPKARIMLHRRAVAERFGGVTLRLTTSSTGYSHRQRCERIVEELTGLQEQFKQNR